MLVKVRVLENSPPGTVIARVTARDRDSQLNGDVIYSFSPLTEQRHGHLLGIKPDSGKIYVKSSASLDHELSSVHLLSVTAVDRGPDPVPVHVTVVIHVEDVNDNPPTISVNTLTADGMAEVAENSSPGTFVAYVAVADDDSGVNGDFRCFVAPTTGNELFTLRQQTFADSEYQLVTSETAEFDRERVDRHDVTITCVDGGTPALTSNAVVRVRVRDANDNAPTFSRELYEFRIDENCAVGTPVGVVLATDDDAGANGEVEYRLEVSSGAAAERLMLIGAYTGQIFTRAEVDREALSATDELPVEFDVVARDRGTETRSSVAHVRVFVDDVDDEPPRFERTRYDFEVAENQPAELEVGRVIAVDRDQSPNNRVVYAIDSVVHGDVGGLLPFRVDSDTGTISTYESLDHERRSSYQFTVSAHSSGRSARSPSATVTVSVSVLDVNDHRPLFTSPLWSNQTVGVSNQAPVGYVITHLRAVDLDSAMFAQLTYRIAAGNRRNTFAIDPLSGALTLAADVRHVVFDDFLLRVSVEDGGRPSLSDTTELRIVISRDIALATTTVDPSLIFAGVLASEHTAVVLAVTLAVILTAILAIAVTICILRRRAHSRRVFRAATESPRMPKGSTAGGKAVWGCPDLRDTDVELPNGQVRQVSDIVGSFRQQNATTSDELRLHQSPIRGYSECNGRMTSFNDRKHSVTSSPHYSDHDDTRLNQVQAFLVVCTSLTNVHLQLKTY